MKNTTKRILTAALAIVIIAAMTLTVVSCGGKKTYTYKSNSVKILLDGKDVSGLYSEMAKNSQDALTETFEGATATVSGTEVTISTKDGTNTVKCTKKDGKLVPTEESMNSVKQLMELESASGAASFDMYFEESGNTLTMVYRIDIATAGQTVSTAEEIVFTK
ncbi:MAG: hypothetical protein K6F14_01650 [Clostridiales bacterium]|nr:hypothetical protein [Clostridiales bacterium]